MQELAVTRHEVELASGAAQVLPVSEEPIPAVLDILLVTRDGRDEAGRAAVKALERRPEHPLDARELEDDVGARVQLGHLAVTERPDNVVCRDFAEHLAVAVDHSYVPRLAHS